MSHGAEALRLFLVRNPTIASDAFLAIYADADRSVRSGEYTLVDIAALLRGMQLVRGLRSVSTIIERLVREAS